MWALGSAASATPPSSVLAARLVSTINLLPKGSDAALYEAQLVAVIQRASLGCTPIRAAIAEAASADVPPAAGRALAALADAGVACGGGVGAVGGGGGPAALAVAPTLGGGGGSDYPR